MNAPRLVTDPSAGWLAHMRRGEFEAAWRISEQVLAAGLNRPSERVPRHVQAIWDGSPLEGQRVLVRCYHGLGDTIQFIRYMPLLKAIARQVIVWVQPSLIPILETAAGIDQLLPLHDGEPDVDYDVDVEIMELPFLFRTTIHTIPNHVPYLRATAKQLALDDRMAVGLVWKAGEWDDRRSVPFHVLEPLARIDRAAFFILQRGPEDAGWRPGFGTLAVTSTTLEDAQLMRALDLLISVDTMPVHLAGALGVPIWNLLQVDADWRWMTGRDDTPWYPTMRLFRQTRPNDWTDVIQRVAKELHDCSKACSQ